MKKLIQEIYSRISQSDIGKRLAKGTFWTFTGTACAKLLVLVSGIICAHILTKAQYGEFGMVRSTINMFVAFGTAGLGLTAAKYISEYRFTNTSKIYSIYCLTNGFAVITGLIVTIIVFFLADYLATNTLSAPYLATSIKVGALLLFVTVVNGSQNGTLQGFENFKSIAINNLYGSAAESAFMLIGAYFYGVFGAVLGFGMGYVVLFIANRHSIRKNLKEVGIVETGFHIDKEDYSLLYKFSIPSSLAGIMIGPVYWIVKTLLVRFDGYEELAIFEASDYWKTIVLFIPTSMSQIILPILSSVVNIDTNKFWKVFKVNLALNLVISLLLAVCITIASPWIMKSYGEGFVGHTTPLIVLCFSTVFSTVSSVIGLSIISRAKMWIGLLFNVIWASLLVAFTFIFLRMGLGATGLAFAFMFAYALHAGYQYLYLRYIVGHSDI